MRLPAPELRLLRRALACGLAALGAAAPAFGQPHELARAEPAAPDTIALTTEEAVALALRHSRQLQSLDTRVEIQELRGSAGWIENPELRVRNLSTRSVNEDFDELQVGLRWRPPAPGEAAEQRQESQVQVWEGKVEARRARDWLASRVRRACADVTLYRELVGLAADRVCNETRRIAQIEAMVGLGRRSIVYYTNAQTEVRDARNEYSRRILALGDEERRLQRLTGAPSPIDVIPESLPEVTQTQDQLLAIAYERRPEVALVEARQCLAVRRRERERWRRWPRLSFIEASRHREAGAGDWHEFMLGVEVPLFGRNGGRRQATELGILRKETESLAIRERIEDEVRDAVAAYTEARLAWQLARDDGQVMIAEARRVIAEAHQHDTLPADEVLELERAILDTRCLMAKKRRELAHAICFLYYALGAEGPEQIGAASPP